MTLSDELTAELEEVQRNLAEERVGFHLKNSQGVLGLFCPRHYVANESKFDAMKKISVLNLILLEADALQKSKVSDVCQKIYDEWVDYEEFLWWRNNPELQETIDLHSSFFELEREYYVRNLLNVLTLVGFSHKFSDSKIKSSLRSVFVAGLSALQLWPISALGQFEADHEFSSPYLKNLWRVLHGKEQMKILKKYIAFRGRNQNEGNIIEGNENPAMSFHETRSKIVVKIPGELVHSGCIVHPPKSGSSFTDYIVFAAEGKPLKVKATSQFHDGINDSSRDQSFDNNAFHHPDELNRVENVMPRRGSFDNSFTQARLRRFSKTSAGGETGRKLKPKRSTVVSPMGSFPNSAHETNIFLAEKLWSNTLDHLGWQNRVDSVKLEDESTRLIRMPKSRFVRKYSAMQRDDLKEKESSKAKHEFVVRGHPTDSFFISAGIDEIVSLWSVDGPKEQIIPITRFESDISSKETRHHSYCTNLAFAPSGQNFCYTNSYGLVQLHSLEKQVVLRSIAHSKRALDCTFIGDRFMLATCGQGADNLSLYDCLLPDRYSKIAGLSLVGTETAYALCYIESINSIILGCGQGNLSVFDLRQRKISSTQKNVHSKAIRCLEVDKNYESMIASGSTDGTIKLWTSKSSNVIQETKHLLGMHPLKHFMNQMNSESMVSQRGVTDIWFTDQNMYSCGADGTVKKTPKVQLQ